jgi:hypothetical protein
MYFHFVPSMDFAQNFKSRQFNFILDMFCHDDAHQNKYICFKVLLRLIINLFSSKIWIWYLLIQTILKIFASVSFICLAINWICSGVLPAIFYPSLEI